MQRTAARRALGTGRSAQPKQCCSACACGCVYLDGLPNGITAVRCGGLSHGIAAAYRYDEESARRAADKHARHLALCADAVHDLVDLAVRTACRIDLYCGPQALNKAFSRSYRVPSWLRAAVSLNGWPCAAPALCRTSGPGLQVKTSEYRTINDDEIVPAKVCR